MEYSAGLILYRNRTPKELEFFLAHPGGVYYRTLENGGLWCFPKGNVEISDWYKFGYPITGCGDQIDAALYAALREFKEETGTNPDFHLMYNLISYLGKIKQRQGKCVYAFGLECTWDLDPKKCYSNTYEAVVDGITYNVPENDDFMWMTYEELKPLTHSTHLIYYQKIMRKY